MKYFNSDVVFVGGDCLMERNKGKSLLSVTGNYTVIDLETTGFSAQYNHIIEVGCIKYREDMEIERYQTLVRPPEPIPYVIECMTGIHNDDVKDAPAFADIAVKIWDFMKDEIIVGHNVSFDINFLYDNFQRSLGLQFQNDFIDTLRLARMLLPNIKEEGYGGYGLTNLCNYFGISLKRDDDYKNELDKIVTAFVENAFPQFRSHRAIPDCQMANELFGCLKKIIIKDNINLEELAKSRDIRQRLKNLQGTNSNFDTSHVFFDKCCVFTGKLERFSRIEAAQIVVNIGGRCEDRITKQTNFLIVGDMDYKKGLEGYESNKLKKAKQLIAKKQDLQILPESAFYDLVSDYLIID